eukprot:765829-Hanusia_phi.AAC.1
MRLSRTAAVPSACQALPGRARADPDRTLMMAQTLQSDRTVLTGPYSLGYSVRYYYYRTQYRVTIPAAGAAWNRRAEIGSCDSELTTSEDLTSLLEPPRRNREVVTVNLRWQCLREPRRLPGVTGPYRAVRRAGPGPGGPGAPLSRDRIVCDAAPVLPYYGTVAPAPPRVKSTVPLRSDGEYAI